MMRTKETETTLMTDSGMSIHLFDDEVLANEITKDLLGTFFTTPDLHRMWDKMGPQLQRKFVLNWKSIIKNKLSSS